MIDERAIWKRYAAIRDQVDERGRRLFAAAEAPAAGRGGIAAVCRATGVARSTIDRGLTDLDRTPLPVGQVRRAGSGRRPLSAKDPSVLDDLRRLIEPVTLGDPMRPLLWVSKSDGKLAKALQAIGHKISPNTVRKLLRQLGYSRQTNRKANDGRQHADRDAQFEHINAQVLAFQAADQPVISVDTKKKELVGNYSNKGTDYRLAGEPRRTDVHDFENKELGYEGQKSGQSQRVDYAGETSRTNTLPSQVVSYNVKVVQNFQEKLRAKYRAKLPEICQFSAYIVFNLPA